MLSVIHATSTFWLRRDRREQHCWEHTQWSLCEGSAIFLAPQWLFVGNKSQEFRSVILKTGFFFFWLFAYFIFFISVFVLFCFIFHKKLRAISAFQEIDYVLLLKAISLPINANVCFHYFIILSWLKRTPKKSHVLQKLD